MHPNNIHNKTYNFDKLCKTLPELEKFLIINPNGLKSINFSNQQAIVSLNKAILKEQYKIDFWDIPDGSLCPAIPGRAEYMHHIYDLLKANSSKKGKIKCLDIGTGASVIYPLLGNSLFAWKFIATDISPRSVKCAKAIVEANQLKKWIDIRLQPDKNHYLKDILKSKEQIDVIVCNPPFFKSQEDALKANEKKNQNLNLPNQSNFQGVSNELWCEGGELTFVKGLILETKSFQNQLGWITTLISKSEHLDNLEKALDYHQVKESKIIPMQVGNKISRILAWRF